MGEVLPYKLREFTKLVNPPSFICYSCIQFRLYRNTLKCLEGNFFMNMPVTTLK